MVPKSYNLATKERECDNHEWYRVKAFTKRGRSPEK
jgi:hypothetical protein